jgi:hypothetical protein
MIRYTYEAKLYLRNISLCFSHIFGRDYHIKDIVEALHILLKTLEVGSPENQIYEKGVYLTQTASTKADKSRLQDNKNDLIKLGGSIDHNLFSISGANDTKAYCKGTYIHMYPYEYLYK